MRGRFGLGVLAAFAAFVLAGSGGDGAGERQRDRQAEVAARGGEVMPFDLERTTHLFAPRRDGGMQTLVSDDGDPEQVALIRAHLRKEADRFRRGDFTDPATIHGHEMPGLAELRAGYPRIEVRYGEIANGARIRYSTDDPALVAALHAWFDAQLMDHGAHAERG